MRECSSLAMRPEVVLRHIAMLHITRVDHKNLPTFISLTTAVPIVTLRKVLSAFFADLLPSVAAQAQLEKKN